MVVSGSGSEWQWRVMAVVESDSVVLHIVLVRGSIVLDIVVVSGSGVL